MQQLDAALDRITKYRLVAYALVALAAVVILSAYTGRLAASPARMIVSLAVILVSTYVTDRGFCRLFKVPGNLENWLITGLILFFIVPNATSAAALLALAMAGAISSASKFLLARHGRHLFNPAAFAAAFLSIWGFWPATWWIGSASLWPFTLLLGLIVVRKLRRFSLFLTFIIVSAVLQTALFMHAHQPLVSNMKHALLASPLIFLSTIMLSEPATMPPRRKLQVVFAALVAVLYVGGWKIGPLVIFPEVALLIGNLFAYLVSPKFRVRLVLKEAHKVSDRIYHYVFTPDMTFSFLPGQSMEWTLAGVPYDSRGNRRTFTIASSPTEHEVHLSFKYCEPASTYKMRLTGMQPGDDVYASQLGGDFTLNGNEEKKLAFIAGGIGITPFRSMIKYLTDHGRHCDITLLYLVSDPREFAYGKELRAAARIGVKTVPIVTGSDKRAPGVPGAKLSPELLSLSVPDFAERIFYISGPNDLVKVAKNHLRNLGVDPRRINTDHFSGY